jgi:hypothetical protein
MPLAIGVTGTIKPYVKVNAKADKWFVRGADGDQEIQRPTFVMDLANIRTGWMRFLEGQAPERVIDPSLDQVAPNPGEGFKRGFVVACFSPKFFGGVAEFSSASIHVSNAVREIYAVFEEQSQNAENRGKVPVVACTGSEAMKDRFGVNYKPTLSLVQWVDRPRELPDTSPVENSEVRKAVTSAPKPQAQHVPPPASAPKPVAAAANPLDEAVF